MTRAHVWNIYLQRPRRTSQPLIHLGNLIEMQTLIQYVNHYVLSKEVSPHHCFLFKVDVYNKTFDGLIRLPEYYICL